MRGNGGRVRVWYDWDSPCGGMGEGCACGMIGISLAGKWGRGAAWYVWDFPCGEMGEGCACGMIGIFLETVSRGLQMGPARRSLR